MHLPAILFETSAAKASIVSVIPARPHRETASESHPSLHSRRRISVSKCEHTPKARNESPKIQQQIPDKTALNSKKIAT